MLRVEDALAATRAALEAGIVSGGGTALAQSAPRTQSSSSSSVTRRSVGMWCAAPLAEPLRWIAINAGFEGDDVVDVVVDLPLLYLFNALTGEYGDMFDEGIIDPFKVTRAALESAASIAALLITTETAGGGGGLR